MNLTWRGRLSRTNSFLSNQCHFRKSNTILRKLRILCYYEYKIIIVLTCIHFHIYTFSHIHFHIYYTFDMYTERNITSRLYNTPPDNSENFGHIARREPDTLDKVVLINKVKGNRLRSVT